MRRTFGAFGFLGPSGAPRLVVAISSGYGTLHFLLTNMLHLIVLDLLFRLRLVGLVILCSDAQSVHFTIEYSSYLSSHACLIIVYLGTTALPPISCIGLTSDASIVTESIVLMLSFSDNILYTSAPLLTLGFLPTNMHSTPLSAILSLIFDSIFARTRDPKVKLSLSEYGDCLSSFSHVLIEDITAAYDIALFHNLHLVRLSIALSKNFLAPWHSIPMYRSARPFDLGSYPGVVVIRIALCAKDALTALTLLSLSECSRQIIGTFQICSTWRIASHIASLRCCSDLDLRVMATWTFG